MVSSSKGNRGTTAPLSMRRVCHESAVARTVIVMATTARTPAAKASASPPRQVVVRAGVVDNLSENSGGDEGGVGASATSGFAGAHP